MPDERIVRYCGLIVSYPRRKTRPPGGLSSELAVVPLEPDGGLRLPFLAAILQIADEAEMMAWVAGLLERADRGEGKETLMAMLRALVPTYVCGEEDWTDGKW